MDIIIKSRKLTILIYKWCNLYLPNIENYGLRSQITRCCISIGSNLVEGNERGKKEFLQFVKISRGSLKELEFQFTIAIEIYNIENNPLQTEILSLIEDISKMSYRLINNLNSQLANRCSGVAY